MAEEVFGDAAIHVRYASSSDQGDESQRNVANVPITGHIGRNAVYRASARLHQFTGDFFSLSCFTKKSVPSLKSLRGAPDQYAVLHVAVLQLPPAVIHSPVRSTSQAQMAFFGLAGSTVHGLLRHQVQGALRR